MRTSILIFLLLAVSVGCTNASRNIIEGDISNPVGSQRLDNQNNVEENQVGIQAEEETLIHYDSDDSDYGETHLKLLNNQTFLFEWKIYGEGGPSTTEEFVLKQGKWMLDRDSVATLLFKDSRHLAKLFYTEKGDEKDFTFVDSKTLQFDLKKTDIHIDGFLLTDFKRNCYCEK